MVDGLDFGQRTAGGFELSSLILCLVSVYTKIKHEHNTQYRFFEYHRALFKLKAYMGSQNTWKAFIYLSCQKNAKII